jgi:hypothetical protein
MGLQSTPAYARILSHPAELDRHILKGLFNQSGALRYGDFTVAPTGTTRQFSISSGHAFLNGQESAQQGGYFAWSDASENQVVGAPSASPRIDTVLLRVWDEQYGTLSSGTSRAQWDIIAGTPNASPVALPDSTFLTGGSQYVPGAWWRLCDIRSNPGDTTIPSGQIYPSNTFARMPGGVTLCSKAASTTGFGGRPSSPVLGDRIYEIDTKLFYHYDGTAWVPDGGQTIYRFNRGPGLSTGNKIINNLAGVQTAFTTATIPCEPNMVYYLTGSGVCGSGAAPATGHRFAVFILDNLNSDVVVAGTQEGSYSGQGVQARVTIPDAVYITGGAQTTMKFKLAFNDASGATGYDVFAEPVNPVWLGVTAAGYRAAQLVT